MKKSIISCWSKEKKKWDINKFIDNPASNDKMLKDEV